MVWEGTSSIRFFPFLEQYIFPTILRLSGPLIRIMPIPDAVMAVATAAMVSVIKSLL